LAARGTLRCAWDRSELACGSLPAWQRGLLWALQLPPAQHPSAPLTALANGLAMGQGEWLHAQPVHLAASLSHLSLVELAGELQVTAEESAALAPALQAHLQAAGCELHVLRSGGWLLQMAQRLQLATVCPTAAAANELQQAMPQGADAAALRRLMTELQMLLHEHPVNQQRLARAVPTINSLWLWGGGVAVASTQPLPAAFGADDYLRGIYRLHAAHLQATPRGAAELTAALQGMHVVAVLDLQAPVQFEREWLVPLVQELRAGRLARLDLLLDSWHLSIDRRSLRRFWRRPLPPGSWIA
jgi:hypothetical protein